jgi:hypothetical protein
MLIFLKDALQPIVKLIRNAEKKPVLKTVHIWSAGRGGGRGGGGGGGGGEMGGDLERVRG